MTKKWFSLPVPNPTASIRLVCFPYAGGMASIYRPWSALLPKQFEMVAIELPGHGMRMAEPLATQINQLIDALINPLLELCDRPLAFFGYSMGSLLAYETAQRLEQLHGIKLQQLFVAAHRAPHLPDSQPTRYNLAPAEFRQTLIELNGTPQEVLDNPELYALIEPILRADFQICNTYPRWQRPKLTCPITAFGGNADPSVTPDELAGWQMTTKAGFNYHILPGDHFFINQQRSLLLAHISQIVLQAQSINGS